MIAHLLLALASFMAPCEDITLQSNYVKHEIQFALQSEPLVYSQGIVLERMNRGPWLEQWYPCLQCSVQCQATCDSSPCTVAISDPAPGHIVIFQLTGAYDMIVGPKLEN